MKLNGYINVRRMGVTLIALMMVLSASAMVMADTEPNNDFTEANWTNAGAYVEGDLDFTTDTDDYYKISLSRNDILDLMVTSQDEGMYLMVYLYDSSQTRVGVSDVMYDFYYINYEAPSTGIYYIQITTSYGSGSYFMTNTVTTGSYQPGGEQFDKATPTSVPWTTGDYAASGGYVDLGKFVDKMKDEMALDMPEDVKISISGSGGVGQYMIFEYVGLDGADYKFDYSCRLYGAFEASGKMSANNADVGMGTTVDGTASGKINMVGDLLYEGSIWLAYYENPAKTKAYWAAEKITLNMQGTLDLSASAKMDVSAEGMSMDGSVDASANADMDIALTFEAEPGIPYMPAKDVDMNVAQTCAISYTGNIEFNMEMDMTATGYIKSMMENDITLPEPVHYKGATSGSFENYFSLYYVQSTKKAIGPALLNGGWAMIMNVNETGLSDFGTRFSGFETTSTFDPIKGMYTSYEAFMGPAGDMMGGFMDSDDMDMTLAPTTKEDAESFNNDPAKFLSSEGVSMPSGLGSLMLILVVVIIVVVVIVVVVMVVMKKKKTPQQPQPYMGAPQQPMYGPQPGYEQPPPQYPPPQQPDQYGNYPPPPPPGQ